MQHKQKQFVDSSSPGKAAINRRHFLASTFTAASTVSLLTPASPWAAEPAPAAGQKTYARKIKLGVVGNGGRGGWIANLFKQHGGYEMHAVADYFQPVADACGDRLGVDQGRRFSSLSGFKRLIESGVEAIALETPPYFFPEHARAAVDAGLHVYMAKPVAVDVPGCLAIEGAAKKATANKKVFMVDYQIPTEPANIEVVSKINGGAIGKVLALHSHYFAGPFPDPPLTDTIEGRLRSLIWCNDVAMGGGYHVNACIHAVDAALWIAGQRPVSALGLSRRGRPDPHGDSHDVFELIFEFPNGLVLNHRGKHIKNFLNFDVVCSAIGETGHAQICYGGKTFLRGKEDAFNQEVANPYDPGAVRNIEKFYQCITQSKHENDTVARALDSVLATIMGREAGLRGARVTLEELLKENKTLEVNLKGLKA